MMSGTTSKACAAKGAVPASVTRVSNTSVSVTCAKAQTSAPLTEGTTAASAAPALLLPALLFLGNPALDNVVSCVIAMGAVAGNLSGTAIIEFAGYSLGSGMGYVPLFAICGSAYLVALAFIQLMIPKLKLAAD